MLCIGVDVILLMLCIGHEADRTRCCERFRGRVCEDTTARAIAVRVRVGGGGGLDAGIEPNMSLAFLHNALDKHDQ